MHVHVCLHLYLCCVGVSVLRVSSSSFVACCICRVVVLCVQRVQSPRANRLTQLSTQAILSRAGVCVCVSVAECAFDEVCAG